MMVECESNRGSSIWLLSSNQMISSKFELTEESNTRIRSVFLLVDADSQNFEIGDAALPMILLREADAWHVDFVRKYFRHVTRCKVDFKAVRPDDMTRPKLNDSPIPFQTSTYKVCQCICPGALLIFPRRHPRVDSKTCKHKCGNLLKNIQI